jgi:DNA helicase-2/ATP-dependent DNA helicase PcrA
VPCRVRGGGAFLEQPEVRVALDGLRRSASPLAGAIGDLATDVRSHDESTGGPAAQRRAVLLELVRLGGEYLALDPTGTVDGFGAWLAATVGAEGGDGPRDAVEIATFHAAKRGLVPIGHAKSDLALDEERRLLYVAITRAEDELHCSWARERTFGTRTVPRQPSPWLADIDAARAALASGVQGADLRERIAEERRKLRSLDGGGRSTSRRSTMVKVGADADPEVLAALKAWRSSAAKAAGVPAYVIFHDTTLAAVAEAQPRNRSSLLELPGLGPVKAERYGDDLLRVVAEHAS